MASITYIIKGDPVPQARPRATMSCKMWDSQKSLKLLRGLQIRNQHNDAPLLNGPLHLDINFFFTPPKKKDLGKHHVYKPDLSNLIKFAEDIATGIIYKDDCIIASISSKKLYDSEARTEITLTQLGAL